MIKPNKVTLPYFDYLLASLQDEDDAVGKSFGRHVHWGYWEQPGRAELSSDDFADAAENLSRQVCAAAGIKDSMRILDVGCGFGGTIAHLNENFADMELLGLNLDDRQLARACRQVKALGRNKIQFQQADACVLPFRNNSFDAVLAVECIFHFPDRKRFFQEAQRVLKPGGFLALSDFVPSEVLLPVARINWPESLSIGFYGKCNFQTTGKKYRQLAHETGLELEVDNDITVNTLPTYTYLRKLGAKRALNNIAGVFETLTLEAISRLRLLKYMVYSFKKL